MLLRSRNKLYLIDLNYFPNSHLFLNLTSVTLLLTSSCRQSVHRTLPGSLGLERDPSQIIVTFYVEQSGVFDHVKFYNRENFMNSVRKEHLNLKETKKLTIYLIKPV